MTAPIVIVGSGLAGYTVAREIRKQSRDLPITLITREEGYFYSKPMLSTAFANGKSAQALITTPAQDMAGQLGVQLMANTEVVSISTKEHTVFTSGGAVAYSSLVLALGADPIRIPLAGDAAHKVMSVNDLSDYAGLRRQLEGKTRVAILGAGLIGTEFANDLLTGQYQVDVIDLAREPLGRLVPPAVGSFIKSALQNAGVRWHLGTTVRLAEFIEGGNAIGLTLEDGERIHADVVLSAIGLKPRIALAEAASIKVERGILVDQTLQTSALDVYALGDCAQVNGLVLPYVMPIMHGARVIASRLSGGQALLFYPAMPVAVKTPAAPCVVAPPKPGLAGAWVEDVKPDGVQAQFLAQDGSLAGYALVGAAVSHKSALTKLLPAVL